MMQMMPRLSCGQLIEGGRGGRRALHERLTMGVPIRVYSDYQKQNKWVRTIRQSYTIEVVDTRASGEVDDEPGSIMIFTLVGDQSAQLQ